MDLTLSKQKIRVAIDQENCPIYLDIEIKKESKSSETITHEKIRNYFVLSISGYQGKYGHYAGQIQDELVDSNIKRYILPKEKLQKLLVIWNNWHLNDLNPNCKHQKAFNCNVKNYTEVAEKETKKCPKKYQYGSNWLVNPLPYRVKMELEQILE